MPTVITKKSTVAAKVPLDTDLQVGELAVNTADKILYSKHSDNQVVKIGFDPAVPGPIGGTTPSTVNATAVTATSAALAGGTRTASGSTLSITETLNNVAVTFPGALVINQTHTASAVGSLIADLQVAGASKFSVRKDGTIKLANGSFNTSGAGLYGATATTTGLAIDYASGGNQFRIFQNGSTRIYITDTVTIAGLCVALIGDTANKAGRFYGPSSGLVELDSGTTGAYRDLKLRNLIATGSISTGLAAKTADYTLTANDGTITADSTSAAITLTLETAVGHTRIHAFKKVAGANLVTIDGNASETIDGATSITLTDRCVLQSNGTEWKQIA